MVKYSVNLFSRLGLIFVGIQTLLTISIPALAKIFPSSCSSFICIFSEEQGYFYLFNLPGIYLANIPFINDFIMNARTIQQRQSGEITPISNIVIFLLSALVYYLIGLGIETILRKTKQLKNRKKSVILVTFGFLAALILFVTLSESFIKIAGILGQKIEQFQRCKNKNGFNTYEWKTIKYQFYCKNGQYDGAYRIYGKDVPDKEYTYKNGTMICEKQYSCGKDLE